MREIELIASIFGFLYVIQAIYSKPSCWVFSFFSALLYIFVFFHNNLYLEALLHVFYAAIAVRGFKTWKNNQGSLKIDWLDKRDHTKELLFCIFMILIFSQILGKFKHAELIYFDSSTTVLSLYATYLASRKLIENWYYWIVIDFVSTGIFYYKGLHYTAILYAIFAVLAIKGLYQWNKELKKMNSKKTSHINRMPTLLVVNGELSKGCLHRIKNLNFEKIICTDGALDILVKSGIIPQVVIGDLDSVSCKLRSAYAKKIQFIEKPSQYASDFEKALDYILESELENILITGIKGKRFDHAVTNLSIIAKYSSQIDIEIIDGDGCGFVLNSERKIEITFTSAEKTIVSLLALPRAEGIHTSGLYYPLNNEDLAFAFREGQSNFSTQEIVNIKFRSGIMIVFVLSKSCCDSPHNLLPHRGTDILNSYHKQEN